MQEGGGAPGLRLRCNMCYNEANGACFRTRCGHLFCESCAFQHFGQNTDCAACGEPLQEADIQDVTVGLDVTCPFGKAAFQEAYKDPNYTSVGQNLHRAAMEVNEIWSFTVTQLARESQRKDDVIAQQNETADKLRHDLGRVTMQLRNALAESEQKNGELGHKLRLREKELLDLQEAYKEKGRKCLAWEKAYGNLRAQVDHGGRGGDGGGGGGGAGGRGGGFTPPPASPRAGTMRAGPSGSFAGASGGQNVERGGAVQQQVLVSPRGGGSGTMPRPAHRTRTTSPYSSSRTGTYMGRSGGAGSGSGGGGGGGGTSRSSWAMPRPTTSRGGGGGGGGSNASPMLRPRMGPGFPSNAVTPSPTFSAQQGTSARFTTKRPETPVELREYYSRNPSPSSRSGGGAGGGGGGGGGTRSGGFFNAPKHGLFSGGG